MTLVVNVLYTVTGSRVQYCSCVSGSVFRTESHLTFSFIGSFEFGPSKVSTFLSSRHFLIEKGIVDDEGFIDYLTEL